MSAVVAGWDHKDVWHKHGRDFLVEVKRHAVAPASFDPCAGLHRWCVYAYIYPKHPHFSAFNGSDIWQDATSVMPLHAGCSFLSYPQFDGKVTSVHVGADYNHLHDEAFTHMAAAESAYEVFRDAEELHAWLTARAVQPEASA